MTTDSIKKSLVNSISIKLLVILVLIVLMQIPLSSVRGLIHERQSMQYQAQTEISKRWGDKGQLGSPVLVIEQEIVKKDERHKKQTSIQSSSAEITIELDAHKRYLGIYEAAVFNAKIQLTGVIEIADSAKLDDPKHNYYLFIPLQQIKSIKNMGAVSINNQQLRQLPQQFSVNESRGFAIQLNPQELQKSINYKIEFSLSASEQMNIIALARKTEVSMRSNWPSPSFIGNHLPDTRVISDKGFEAYWQINQLNMTSGADSHFVIDQNDGFGVKIHIPANTYQVNERTVKYSFLIIVLSFAGFFLTELFFKLRLHPFQYLLIGFSLSTFYLLLLSISEYLSFNWAFLLSASAIIALISSYCSVVLKQTQRGLYTGLLFTLLYGFIYILVKAEEASLLMGAIAILFILSLVMYLTRKIDWYAVGEEK
ncbi:MAG TPA: cell envelope integrity protein CreD [Oceanospirillales bacterium]|nr:cell envelope integrity protein CreD [Oceanospirillales bacterium]